MNYIISTNYDFKTLTTERHISNAQETLMSVFNLQKFVPIEYFTFNGNAVFTSYMELGKQTFSSQDSVVIFENGVWMKKDEFDLIKGAPVKKNFRLGYVNGTHTPFPNLRAGVISGSKESGYRFWFEFN